MPILPSEGQYDAIVRVLESILGTGGGSTTVTGPRLLADITGTAGVASAETLMPAATVCAGFYLTNRSSTNKLHYAAVVAALTSAFVLPMQTVYVPAGLDDAEGVFTIAAVAGVDFTITPIG